LSEGKGERKESRGEITLDDGKRKGVRNGLMFWDKKRGRKITVLFRSGTGKGKKKKRKRGSEKKVVDHRSREKRTPSRRLEEKKKKRKEVVRKDRPVPFSHETRREGGRGGGEHKSFP